MKDVIVSWSGGKDSALAVHNLLKDNKYQVKGLLSTTSKASGRLPMHEVQRELIYAQADSLGLPLYEVTLPLNAGNDIYEQMLNQQFNLFKKSGINTIVYADLFLEDIKEFRDQHLSTLDMDALYPLWGKDTRNVARDFISEGFEAIVTTVDNDKLPTEMVGKWFDEKFINSLPEDVDPCGENGEFHTFVFAGPTFNHPVSFSLGEKFATKSGRFIHVELISV